MNKPIGVITSVSDERNRRTVIDILRGDEKLKPILKTIFPVGRLDYDSEGLLILTNDGQFANELMHPRQHVPKTYVATLTEPFNRDDIKKLESGIDIDGEITHPARVKVTGLKRIELTITQGRNRQVRRMLASLNYSLTTLRRVAIGKLTLENIDVGQYKILNTRPNI